MKQEGKETMRNDALYLLASREVGRGELQRTRVLLVGLEDHLDVRERESFMKRVSGRVKRAW